MRILAALLLAFVLTFTARAAEPWLKAGDVVALVGGEDMVAVAEEGWLETLVTWAQPKDRIRFRSLAWEGDTVFEQRRDLNYPTLEAQLDKIGATAVICQFGKMESFAGKDGVAAFTEAYEKLLARLNPEGKRRIALVLPSAFSLGDLPVPGPQLSIDRKALLEPYTGAMFDLLMKHKFQVLFDGRSFDSAYCFANYQVTRDGFHLNPHMELPLARDYAVDLGLGPEYPEEVVAWKASPGTRPLPWFESIPKPVETLNAAIRAKNRMWFHYSRPQNWAFLAGNRTNQPSSRDHLDPTKRWFPEEMEQWLPLIEAKEKEIWAMAEAHQ